MKFMEEFALTKTNAKAEAKSLWRVFALETWVQMFVVAWMKLCLNGLKRMTSIMSLFEKNGCRNKHENGPSTLYFR